MAEGEERAQAQEQEFSSILPHSATPRVSPSPRPPFFLNPIQKVPTKDLHLQLILVLVLVEGKVESSSNDS